MGINKELLKQRLNEIYNGNLEKISKSKTIENAISIYKEIKKYEKFNFEGVADYNKELLEAKYDLQIIFGINYVGLTKNKIYLAHQSAWVNNLYIMLNEGDL